MHGVKIAVPLAKMSRQDIEYLENVTGLTLHEDKSRADPKKSKSSDRGPQEEKESGATITKDQKPEYDWFQFFLSCEVAVGLCERYAQAFIKDSMDESVLPDVDAKILRTLGLREGDIIKVMRTLDAKYGRQRGHPEGDGGLFSGPGGTLRNNTRKGRPPCKPVTLSMHQRFQPKKGVCQVRTPSNLLLQRAQPEQPRRIIGPRLVTLAALAALKTTPGT
jgi:actin cytoskeleton-regulatory complex protein SLA1